MKQLFYTMDLAISHHLQLSLIYNACLQAWEVFSAPRSGWCVKLGFISHLACCCAVCY